MSRKLSKLLSKRIRVASATLRRPVVLLRSQEAALQVAGAEVVSAEVAVWAVWPPGRHWLEPSAAASLQRPITAAARL
jgi:hypothetical protein